MGSLVVDHTTGAVFLMYTVNNQDVVPQPTTVENKVLLMSSTNDGQTWSAPQDITSSVMNPDWEYFELWARQRHSAHRSGPTPDGWSSPSIIALVTTTTAAATSPTSAVIYSDNDGATWQFGGRPQSELCARTPAPLKARSCSSPTGRFT